uniref:Tim44 domain-containing protein n=1 Tax=Strongyloides papillosus TaxID=174720 RepID=A0A0N5B6A9_STREA
MKYLYGMRFHNILKHTITNGQFNLKQPSFLLGTAPNRSLYYDIGKFCGKKEIAIDNKPTTEQLLAVDNFTESLIPRFFKEPLTKFLKICSDDVTFNDKMFNYNIVGKDNLSVHIAKIRFYYRYMSPYNKLEYKGSTIYENDNYVTVLWRMNTLQSTWKKYLPEFMLKNQSTGKVIEGAMEIYIDKDGQIFQLINRKLNDTDKTEAEKLDLLKKQQPMVEEYEENKAK